MKVLALAGYDSFLNTARLIAPYFEKHGASVEFGIVKARSKTQITERQVAEMGIERLVQNIDIRRFCEEGRFRDYDIILSCLEGLSSRRIFYYLAQHDEKRPFVISLYPGLLLRNAYEGHAARAPADRIWLNCRRDLQAYQAMCRSFGMDGSNARLFGLASVLEKVERMPVVDRNGPVVFFEQAVIPRFYEERKYMVEALCDLARRYPDRSFLIKARASGKQATLHSAWHAIDKLLDEVASEEKGVPDNIQMTGETATQLLSCASCCLTVTSTVAVEAIHAGVPTALVSDIGASDDYGLQYFYGSNLLTGLEQLDLDNVSAPDPDWLLTHTHDPYKVIEDLVQDCIENAKTGQLDHWSRSIAMGSMGIQKTLLQPDPEYFLSQGYKKRRSIFSTIRLRIAKWLGH
ncbi:DUF6716 putative glycosyltransferase [Roseibium marinum]|uniref:Uncharacterized protein n=1 Tax=Roseibium marinum TaxID=281252 RepID=A0A2S3V3J8_9HYPH|nr:DUF6716 putative glycosyltransferase [Roseibium marinum]POF34343.1 hypothetical protein CLV41_101797 [Roseibium marinum]